MSGQYYLRYLFLHPEQSGEYFEVFSHDNEYHKKRLLDSSLSEDKLPAERYYAKPDSYESIMVGQNKNRII